MIDHISDAHHSDAAKAIEAERDAALKAADAMRGQLISARRDIKALWIVATVFTIVAAIASLKVAGDNAMRGEAERITRTVIEQYVHERRRAEIADSLYQDCVLRGGR